MVGQTCRNSKHGTYPAIGLLVTPVQAALLFADQVNEFVKRVRAAKIHILIMGHLRKKMPAMMGKQKAQEKLLANLQAEFGMVQREYHLPAGMTPAMLFEDAARQSSFSVLLLKASPHAPHHAAIGLQHDLASAQRMVRHCLSDVLSVVPSCIHGSTE